MDEIRTSETTHEEPKHISVEQTEVLHEQAVPFLVQLEQAPQTTQQKISDLALSRVDQSAWRSNRKQQEALMRQKASTLKDADLAEFDALHKSFITTGAAILESEPGGGFVNSVCFNNFVTALQTCLSRPLFDFSEGSSNDILQNIVTTGEQYLESRQNAHTAKGKFRLRAVRDLVNTTKVGLLIKNREHDIPEQLRQKYTNYTYDGYFRYFKNVISRELVGEETLKSSLRDKMMTDDFIEKYIMALFIKAGSCTAAVSGLEHLIDSKDLQIRCLSESYFDSEMNVPEDVLRAKRDRIEEGLVTLIGDVLYWGGTDAEATAPNATLNATEVLDFKLRGSDMHDRGLGVAIVTFKIDDNPVKWVIKPDDRSFEQKLFGTQEGSAANQFNQLAETGAVKAGEDTLHGRVTTFDIRVKQGRGSLIQFIDGQEVSELKPNDIERTQVDDSKALTQIFATIFGISDLHHENVLYLEVEDKTVPVMIDADNVFHNGCFRDLSKTSSQTAFTFTENPLANKAITGVSAEFLEFAKQTLANGQSRIVPIETALLDTFAANFILCPSIIQLTEEELIQFIDHRVIGEDAEYLPANVSEAEGNKIVNNLTDYIDALKSQSSLGGLQGLLPNVEGSELVYGMTDDMKRNACLCAINDYKKGQIPFFSYNIATGQITTHERPVFQGPKLTEIWKGDVTPANFFK